MTKTPSETDVALKAICGMVGQVGWDWQSLGGAMPRAPLVLIIELMTRESTWTCDNPNDDNNY